ncbi:MAG: GHKL domain-containing protein [Oscillospiraceae bacterium]|nr:GHKL domain-containing protein [Oscillospiraceae bacterium]
MNNWILLVIILSCAAIVIVGTVIILRLYISKLVDKKIFAFQNDIITKHCNEVDNIYRQMRGWRHDYHNHIQAVIASLALNQYSEASEYLRKLNDDLASVDTVIKTGNIMVDAILNSKISLALNKKIYVNAKATVPQELKISEIDLCVIVGNLIDNAMEACLKLPDESERRIRIYVGIFKNYLYISVANTAGGKIKRSETGYISSKGENHGFGLMRVDKIAAKYGGHVNRQNEEDAFATEIMLPL